MEIIFPLFFRVALLLGILEALPGKKPVAKRAADPSMSRMGPFSRLVALCHAASCRGGTPH